jgi:hypothetical protein
MKKTQAKNFKIIIDFMRSCGKTHEDIKNNLLVKGKPINTGTYYSILNGSRGVSEPIAEGLAHLMQVDPYTVKRALSVRIAPKPEDAHEGMLKCLEKMEGLANERQ